MNEQPSRSRRHVATLALGVLTALLFSRALIDDHGFVGLDDIDNLVENDGYAGLGLENLRWAFTAAHLGVYEPVSWIFRSVQHEVFGKSAFGFHAVTLLLHLANTLLVLSLARRLLAATLPEARPGRIETGSLLAAALFALHPLRVEVVSWASGQPYALATCFSLLSIRAYLGYAATPDRTGRLMLAGLLYVLGVLSKSAVIALPLAMLLLDLLPTSWPKRSPRRVLAEKLPLFGAAVGLAWLALAATRDAQTGFVALDLTERLARTIAAPVVYLVNTVWPVGLTAHDPVPAEGLRLTAPATLFSAAVVVGISLWLLARRSRRGAAVAWLAFLAVLAPVAGLLQHGAPTLSADRYAYASMIPLAILGGAFFARLPSLGRAHACVAVVVLALFGTTTWRQVGTWADTESLWNHALAIDPHNSFAGNNLGYMLLSDGRLEEAASVLERAYPFGRENEHLTLNLGYCLEQLERYYAALYHYEQALVLHEQSPGVHNNLAVIFLHFGYPDEARIHYKRALELDPQFAPARAGLESMQR
jgi:Tfp pilus assembly protein PilF